MAGFWSKLFGGCASCASSENEVAAAIAVALQMYTEESSRGSVSKVCTTMQRRSDWANKSYGLTQLPQRNKRW